MLTVLGTTAYLSSLTLDPECLPQRLFAGVASTHQLLPEHHSLIARGNGQAYADHSEVV